MTDASARMIAALEQSGAAIMEQHRQAILDACDGIADDWLDRVTVAIANNLPSGGVKNLEFGPVKNAVLASQSAIGDATNAQLAKVFDAIEAALKSAK